MYNIIFLNGTTLSVSGEHESHLVKINDLLKVRNQTGHKDFAKWMNIQERDWSSILVCVPGGPPIGHPAVKRMLTPLDVLS